MKKKIKIFILLLFISVFMAGCGDSRKDNYDTRGRKEIVLAIFKSNDLVRERVTAFNKASEQYYITMNVYCPDNADADEIEDALKLFNTAIVAKSSSRNPDIVVTTARDYTRLAQRGAFVDLSSYLEADEKVKREDLYEQVLNALLVDEKLYGVSASFGLLTLLMTQAAADSDMSLESIVEFQKKSEYCITNVAGRMINVRLWMNQYLNEFIDWEKGTCDFNNPRFFTLMELLDVIPDTFYPSMKDFLDAVLNNEPLFILAHTYNPYEFQGATKAWKMNVSGFPGREDEFNVNLPGGIYSITRSSRNKQAAWDFISTIFDEEYQAKNMGTWEFGIPISKKVFEQYIKEHSVEVIINDKPITKYKFDDYAMSHLTPETINKFNQLFDMKMYLSNDDEVLMNIIMEEMEVYASGMKPLEQVIETLNNRVGLYLKENR